MMIDDGDDDKGCCDFNDETAMANMDRGKHCAFLMVMAMLINRTILMTC